MSEDPARAASNDAQAAAGAARVAQPAALAPARRRPRRAKPRASGRCGREAGAGAGARPPGAEFVADCVARLESGDAGAGAAESACPSVRGRARICRVPVEADDFAEWAPAFRWIVAAVGSLVLQTRSSRVTRVTLSSWISRRLVVRLTRGSSHGSASVVTLKSWSASRIVGPISLRRGRKGSRAGNLRAPPGRQSLDQALRHGALGLVPEGQRDRPRRRGNRRPVPRARRACASRRARGAAAGQGAVLNLLDSGTRSARCPSSTARCRARTRRASRWR